MATLAYIRSNDVKMFIVFHEHWAPFLFRFIFCATYSPESTLLLIRHPPGYLWMVQVHQMWLLKCSHGHIRGRLQAVPGHRLHLLAFTIHQHLHSLQVVPRRRVSCARSQLLCPARNCDSSDPLAQHMVAWPSSRRSGERKLNFHLATFSGNLHQVSLAWCTLIRWEEADPFFVSPWNTYKKKKTFSIMILQLLDLDSHPLFPSARSILKDITVDFGFHTPKGPFSSFILI